MFECSNIDLKYVLLEDFEEGKVPKEYALGKIAAYFHLRLISAGEFYSLWEEVCGIWQ